MTPEDVANWMLEKIARDGCLYQDEVVDYVVRSKAEDLLRGNCDGNLVIGTKTLTAFRTLAPDNVVCIRTDLYWWCRVPEDEPGKDERG